MSNHPLRYLTAFCLLAAFIGCDKKDQSAPAPTASSSPATGQKAYKIAVIPKGTSHSFWKSVENGAEQAAKEFGVTVIWSGPPREDDRSQQIGLVEQFISGGIDGICLAPLDSSALVDPVAEAKAKNIPVIIFDSPLKGEAGKDFVSLTATDNHKGGEMAGEELARIVNNKGKVVMMRYAVGSASTEQREQGFLDAIAKHPDIQVIEKDRYAGATLNEGQTNAENMLDKLRQADGIFCSNESCTQAMMNVLRDNKLTQTKKFVGFDTSVALLDGLKSGDIQALVAQDPTHMGYTAVKTMVQKLNGESVPTNIDTGCALVTMGNLNTPDIQKLLSGK